MPPWPLGSGPREGRATADVLEEVSGKDSEQHSSGSSESRAEGGCSSGPRVGRAKHGGKNVASSDSSGSNESRANETEAPGLCESVVRQGRQPLALAQMRDHVQRARADTGSDHEVVRSILGETRVMGNVALMVGLPTWASFSAASMGTRATKSFHAEVPVKAAGAADYTGRSGACAGVEPDALANPSDSAGRGPRTDWADLDSDDGSDLEDPAIEQLMVAI